MSTQPEDDVRTVAGASRTDALLERRRELMGTPYRLFYSDPVELVRGTGPWVFDADGRRYLDAYNNVPCVGHAHPLVVEAISRQTALINTHTRYLSAVTLDYAERLLATLPDVLGHVMFTCSGSEANDLALQIARYCTGNSGVIVTSHAYHGTTAATAAVSPSLRPIVAASSEVEFVAAPPSASDSVEDAAAFAGRVAQAVDALAARGAGVAALLMDSVLASDGLVPEPAGFLRGAAEVVRAAGGVYIADEVQAGFGRTGRMWGFERHGVVPDIVTLGKPMGNGYPVAGLAARAELVDAFGQQGRYFNTFAGSPVACAAGLAVLDVIAAEGLVERTGIVGAQLLERLRPLIAVPGVRDVRGVGLFVGIEIDDGGDAPLTAGDIVENMRHHGVLAGVTGPGSRVVKIRPPLAFSEAQIDPLAHAVERALRT
jgi:4-aminobutyrate aminotransferase-like enzyme